MTWKNGPSGPGWYFIHCYHNGTRRIVYFENDLVNVVGQEESDSLEDWIDDMSCLWMPVEWPAGPFEGPKGPESDEGSEGAKGFGESEGWTSLPPEPGLYYLKLTMASIVYKAEVAVWQGAYKVQYLKDGNWTAPISIDYMGSAWRYKKRVE